MAAAPDAIERFGRLATRLPFVRGRRPEPLPLTLDRKRIYVLPTRIGLLVAALLCAMLVGALNYNNNPGLMLAFLLAAVVHNGLVMAHLTLSGLQLSSLQAAPVHAGEPLAVSLRLLGGRRARSGLELLDPAGATLRFDLPAGADTELQALLPTQRRGWLPLGRWRLSTTRPLGLVRAWSWWQPDTRVLVYPRPERDGPPLPGALDDGRPQSRPQRSGEDVHHLREYRRGDAPRQIAWKASARLDRPMVREYESGSGRDVELDWLALSGLPDERRIARLTRWVLDAEREGRRYRLSVPGTMLGPARGAEHRHACLRALALLPGGTQ